MWPDKLEKWPNKECGLKWTDGWCVRTQYNEGGNGKLVLVNVEAKALDVNGADFWYNAKKFLMTKKTDEDEKASSRHWFASQCR